MRRSGNPRLVAFVAALLVLAAWLLLRDRATPTTPVRPASPAGETIREATLVLRHQGKKQAEVRAVRMTVTPDLRYARFQERVRATVYDRGAVALELRADEVVLDRQTNDLRATGRLVVTSPRGFRLSAPEARWVATARRVVFPSGIEVRTADSLIRAGRLTVDLGMEAFELDGGVEMAFRLPVAGP